MSLLVLGLLVAVVFETFGVDLAARYVGPVGKMPPVYVAANALWTLGAIILIIPPVMDGVEILVVLEIFLTASGFMAYWQPDAFWLKVASRVGVSLLAVGWLKYRGLLPDFNYPSSLVHPRFYREAWRTGDNRALAVGLELLGIGYALGSMTLLTVGSAYLVRSSWMGWRNLRKPIFMMWTGLNVAYTVAGVWILAVRILR